MCITFWTDRKKKQTNYKAYDVDISHASSTNEINVTPVLVRVPVVLFTWLCSLQRYTCSKVTVFGFN